MSHYDAAFWRHEQYNDLAREYEDGIEITHPYRGSCDVCGSCRWGATAVTYYEYRGESI